MASQNQPAAAAVEDTRIPESDIPKYDSLLQTAKGKVEELKKWKDKNGEISISDDFKKALQETLGYCSAAFGIFRDDRQFFDHAEELASAIVEMRNHMGQELMPLNRFHAFNRGTFEIRGQTLISAQYYEELPFYGPPRQADVVKDGVTKFYEWQLIDKPRASVVPGTPVKCIYYLEKGKLNETYYVLGMTAPGMHATIQTFHGEIPSFFNVEELIVKRLLQKETSVQAASYRH